MAVRRCLERGWTFVRPTFPGVKQVAEPLTSSGCVPVRGLKVTVWQGVKIHWWVRSGPRRVRGQQVWPDRLCARAGRWQKPLLNGSRLAWGSERRREGCPGGPLVPGRLAELLSAQQ